jgi:tRNA (guanine-N1)-methyltransferase
LLKERITKNRGFIEYPQYTRPEFFCFPPWPRLRRAKKKGFCWRVPKVLLSGHHKKIEEWRKKHGKAIEK